MNNFVAINFCDKSNQQAITKKDIRMKKTPLNEKENIKIRNRKTSK